ncbi:Por secretion system C-terminal sorting domain-containing protein [Formosa sp. Hel1_31_208]|uniref:endonuclease n=1 Tax=Formosa sp. Hel1_31_208 TaxID=1798225 RepID=UPI00087CD285|nr:endonuclease [Formosa sp. Hel1_31_208]SDS11382.1 Por secretion system C-terminal sorting domain-containing protein [Formosa sp. Hel1_31_208]
MKKSLFYFISICFMQLGFAQVVINELDCDTPGVDTMEFIELLSETPNYPLDGFVLVFFNGSASGMNSSYFTVDLDGFITDINGLFLIGSNSVSPVPQFLISENVFQNGADAVAIYQANDIDFPEDTVATIDNLVDVLLYDTGEPNDDDMIAIFSQDPRFTNIQQINEGPNNNTNSIQRFVDMDDNVTYVSTVPTPRQLNDGSGIVLNGITMSIAQTQYNEGGNFDITFTSETPVVGDLNFNILLDNNGFNSSDFTGDTALTIPNNQTTTSTTITLIDDSDDEGDEVTKIRFENLPIEYLALNNNLAIRIVDNDFTVANFGTPLNPTFGNVTSTQPGSYYNTLDGLADTALRQALQDIIAEEGVVRTQTYADVNSILAEADQNPLNSNEVWLLYTEQGRPKLDLQTGSNNVGKWNREHTYPRSRGGFDAIEEDEIADGIDIFWNTTADSLRHGYSDAHALRAADGPENSSRNNKHYGDPNMGAYNGPVATAGSFYGDVARSVLYMEIRYNGLQVVNGYPENGPGELGDLATLLDWHRNDPPDDYEMNRNNVVYTWQFNRNPFIDQPDLVEYIWGNNVGQTWDQQLSISDFDLNNIIVYPNPTQNSISIKGLQSEALVAVFSMEGRAIKTLKANPNTNLDLNLSSGLYLLQITSGNKATIKKLAVK